jgi:hypothetical protein
MANNATILIDQVNPVVAAVGAAVTGQVLRVTGTGPLTVGFATLAVPTAIVKVGDFSTASATPVDVTGMTVVITAGTYLVTLNGQVDNAANMGVIGFNGPTLTRLNSVGMASIFGVQSQSAYDQPIAGNGALNGQSFFVSALLIVSANGTLAVRLWDGSGTATNATLKAGSTLTVLKVA